MLRSWLGGSGSGKTTLVDILALRIQNTKMISEDSRIRYDNTLLCCCVRSHEDLFSYVPQADSKLLNTATAYKTVVTAVALRMGPVVEYAYLLVLLIQYTTFHSR